MIDRLAADLRAEFPDQRGWSRRTCTAGGRWPKPGPDDDFVQQLAAQLAWGHLMVLLDKLSSRKERDWYAAAAAEHGWSRDVLTHQVASRLAERVGSAPSRFAAALPAPDNGLAQQLVRDRYVFDHLALSERAAERELERALMDRLERTLLAFGDGMAFVGRQVRFDVDGDELVLDLLLVSLEQLRYVVVELKIGRFDPAFVGQLGTYVAVVDDRLRRPSRRAPTVGILLCKARNDTLVRYALAGGTATARRRRLHLRHAAAAGARGATDRSRARGRPRHRDDIGLIRRKPMPVKRRSTRSSSTAAGRLCWRRCKGAPLNVDHPGSGRSRGTEDAEGPAGYFRWSATPEVAGFRGRGGDTCTVDEPGALKVDEAV